MKRLLMSLGVLVAVLLPAAPAAAHNALAEATPAKNAILKKAPEKVSLRFLQKLNPEFTTIVVSDAAKRKVPVSEPAIDGATGSVTFTEPPANGAYTVAYRVVSLDGHTVKGSYQFTVADPAATAAPAATAPATGGGSAAPIAPVAATALPAESTGGVSGPVVAALAGAGVVLVGLSAFFFLRTRRSPDR